MGKLVLLLADGKTREFKLRRERVTIGRRADNDVCLPYPAVSSEHAAVVTVLADSFLEDLGSTNGTLVNGKPIARHLLRDRDRIDIGREELVYLEDESATLEPTRQQLDRARTATFGERVEQARPLAPPATPSSVVVAAAARLNETPSTKASAAAEGSSLALRVPTGTSTDRVVPLTRDETFVGRAGVQVVAIQRAAGGVRVVPVEGAQPPILNGLPLDAGGARIAPGDVLEIAGTKVRMIALPDGAR